MNPLGTTPFRSAPISPPQRPPRDLSALASLGCIGGIGALALGCAPIFVQWLALPMLLVGGSLLGATVLWKRRRVFRSNLAAASLVLCLLPLAERALDWSIKREVRAVRVAARRFHAERARWPRGFAELSSLRLLHVCARRFGVNCLQWSDPSRFDPGSHRPPFLIRYVYPGFARYSYSLESDAVRFVD